MKESTLGLRTVVVMGASTSFTVPYGAAPADPQVRFSAESKLELKNEARIRKGDSTISMASR
jgi:hypothetical protein